MPQTGDATIMRTKYFREEDVFEFIWMAADADGMWEGNDATIAAAFGVTEDEAYEVLSKLCVKGHLERVYVGTFAITKWREPGDASEEDVGGKEGRVFVSRCTGSSFHLAPLWLVRFHYFVAFYFVVLFGQ
jgi:hypothetical protein